MVGLCTPAIGSSDYNTKHRIFLFLDQVLHAEHGIKKGKFFKAKQTYRISGH